MTETSSSKKGVRFYRCNKNACLPILCSCLMWPSKSFYRAQFKAIFIVHVSLLKINTPYFSFISSTGTRTHKRPLAIPKRRSATVWIATNKTFFRIDSLWIKTLSEWSRCESVPGFASDKHQSNQVFLLVFLLALRIVPYRFLTTVWIGFRCTMVSGDMERRRLIGFWCG